MSPSLLDRFDLGGARAVANARHEMLRPRRDALVVARLRAAIADRDASRARRAVGESDPAPAAVESAA